MNNRFSQILKSAAKANPAQPVPSRESPLFLIHLRLGDVVPFPQIVPDHVVIPFLYDEPIPIKHIGNHPRRERWQECVDLIESLRHHFGAGLRIGLISDGVDRAFQILRTPDVRTHLEGMGADMSDARLEALEQYYREELESDFSGLDFRVIGEDETAFASSLELIKQADFCFSTSGHFIVHFTNHSRPPQKPPLILFCDGTQGRFLITSEPTQTQLLKNDPRNDIPRIVSEVADHLAARKRGSN